MRTLEHDRWFAEDGDNTWRITYHLTEDSVVFDVGGFEGGFAEKIYQKYHCKIFIFEPVPKYYNKIVERFKGNKDIVVVNFALADKCTTKTIYLQGDATGFHGFSIHAMQVKCITLQNAMALLNVQEIALIKLNIEGAEYDVLKHMFENDLVSKCENIQVQFHRCVLGYEEKYLLVNQMLMKTHYITYRFPFVWENYKRIER